MDIDAFRNEILTCKKCGKQTKRGGGTELIEEYKESSTWIYIVSRDSGYYCRKCHVEELGNIRSENGKQNKRIAH